MDFGKVHSVEGIDFSLPPDPLATQDLLRGLRGQVQEPLRLHVGCTSWGRKDWIGKIYPKGAKEKDLLGYYVKQFNTIELNALFYHLQTKAVLEKWAALTGPEFRFCPKFLNTISHLQQLRNAEAETDRFLDHMLAFGSRLGPSFLQLSDSFGPDRASVLGTYLRALPRDFRVCVELRQESWFGSGGGAGAGGKRGQVVEDTWQLMRDLGVGTVITDTSGRRDVLHMRLTAPVAFIRFVANNGHPTDFLRMEAWAERLRLWSESGLKEVYFFVHSHDEFHAPDLVRHAVELFNRVCGTAVPPPKMVPAIGEGENLRLF